MTSKASERPPPHEGSSAYKGCPRSPQLAGTRGYPYPQDPTRAAYPPPPTHIPVYAQLYRENPYQVDRPADFVIESYHRENENHLHHQHQHPHHHQIRRRPSLLPTPADYAAAAAERDRYLDTYRLHPYEREVVIPSPAAAPPTGSAGAAFPATALHVVPSSVQLSAGVGSRLTPHPSQLEMVVTTDSMVGSKRPRLVEAKVPHLHPALHQPLLIDTREVVEIKKEPAYTPQVEAISPTLPTDDLRSDLSPQRSSKDDLLQSIDRVEREISQVESQVNKLKKKQQELEVEGSKPPSVLPKPDAKQDNSASEPKQMSIAQVIYSENRKKAHLAHSVLGKLGLKVDLPIYNQPSDTAVYHENKRKFLMFKKKLIMCFKKRQQEKLIRENYLTDTYNQLMRTWLKKMEKREANTTKKMKEAKLREFFEKQFPELKKQREDKERFSRVGQRIRSDAELEEIMDGLQEQEMEDKKMRSYAVIPPIILEPKQRRLQFLNQNGLLEDSMAEYKERQMLNVWSDAEKEIFRDKFLQHPKNFCLIATYLDRKSVAECIQYYYLTKKRENYKQLLRKHNVKKRTRALVKPQAQQPPINSQGGISTRQQEEAKALAAAAAAAAANTSAATTTTNSTNTTSGQSTVSTTSSPSVTTMASQVSTTPSSTPSTATTTTTVSSVSTTSTSSTLVSSTVSASAAKDEVESSTEETGQPVAAPDLGEAAVASSSAGVSAPTNTQSVTTSASGTSTLGRETGEKEMAEDAGDEMSDDNNERAAAQTNENGGVHPCAVCKTELENFSQSRPLSRSNCDQYGLKDEEISSDMRVCSSCRFKSVRRRYTHCPIPTCKTPKRKVKRLRPLPGKWAELTQEAKDAIISELKIPPDVSTCCSACFNRIARKLGANPVSENEEGAEPSRWTEEEMDLAKRGLRQYGMDWSSLAQVVQTKTKEQCKNFYFNYKRKLGLEEIVIQYRETHAGAGDSGKNHHEGGSNESGETTSSCEEDDCGPERCNSSDTASAPSPKSLPPRLPPAAPVHARPSNGKVEEECRMKELENQEVDKGQLMGSFLQGASIHHRPVADYDSSATVSAEEDQGCPNDSSVITLSPNPVPLKDDPPVVVGVDPFYLSQQQQQQPHHLHSQHLDGQHPLLMKKTIVRPSSNDLRQEVMPPQQQGMMGAPKVPMEEPTCVRDLIYHAIEMSLQQPAKGGSRGNPVPAAMVIKDRDPIKLDMAKRNQQESMGHHERHPVYVSNPGIARPEGLAVMATFSHLARVDGPPPPPPPPLQPGMGQDMDQSDYEVQDLSKKDKPNKDFDHHQSLKRDRLTPIRVPSDMGYSTHMQYGQYGAPPPAHSNQFSRSSQPPPPELTPHFNSSNVAQVRPEDNRRELHQGGAVYYASGKRVSPTVGPGGLEARPKSQPPHLISQSIVAMPTSSTPPGGMMVRGPQQKGMVKGSVPPPPPLITSKPDVLECQMSPKLHYKDKAMAHLQGSITEGTPVNKPVVPGGIPGRYAEGLLRQVPPPHASKEGGSITLGTPVPHDLVSKRGLNGRSQPDSSGSVHMDSRDPSRGAGLQNVYDHPSMVEQYYRRMSPNTANSAYQLHGAYPPPSFPPTNYGSNPPPPSGPSRPPYASESQLSSKQIMIDFNTSKQMQMRRGSASSEKDMRASPRAEPGPSVSTSGGVPADGRMHSVYAVYPPGGANQVPFQPPPPPLQGYMVPGDQQRFPGSPLIGHDQGGPGQPPPESQMSPGSLWAKHPSSAQNPSVQARQNVIQRSITWGTGKPSVIRAPKSTSPREPDSQSPIPLQSSRKESPSPRFSHPTGHDAFNALVNAAAAQPSLAVPSKEEMGRRASLQASSPGIMGRPEMVRSPRDRPAVEGLEKSLLEMHHQRPRSHSETGLHSLQDQRYRDIERGRASADNLPAPSHHPHAAMHHPQQPQHLGPHQPHQMMDGVEGHPPVMLIPPGAMMEEPQHRHRPHQQMVEQERIESSEKARFLPEQSLRFSGVREPFSKEQFEREMRQQDIPPTRQKEAYALPLAMRARDSTTKDGRVSSDMDEASKIFSQSFQKDCPKPNPSPRGFTAAKLIDAIIMHQINQNTDNGSVTPSSSGPVGMSKNPPVDRIFNCYRQGDDRNSDPRHKVGHEEIVTIDDERGDRPPTPPIQQQHPHHVLQQQQQQQQQQQMYHPQPGEKVVTLGEHIANVIAKNYNGPGEHQNMSMYSHNRIHEQHQQHQHPHGGKLPIGYNQSGSLSVSPSLHTMEGKVRQRPTMLHASSAMRSIEGDPMNSHPVSDAEIRNSWKLRRALQHEKEMAAAASAAAEASHQTPPPSSSSPAMGNHEERQIIRIAQSPGHTNSSRSSSRSSPHPLTPYAVEPISPPSQNAPDSGEPSPHPPQSWITNPGIAGLLTNRRVYMGGTADDRTGSGPHPSNPGSGGQQPMEFTLDYVKNRIVEVMRTATGDGGGGEPESSGRASQGSPEGRYHQPHSQKQPHPDSDIYAERPQSTGSSRSTPKEMMAHRFSPASAGSNFIPRTPTSSQPPSERATPQEAGRSSYKRPLEGNDWMSEVASSHNASPSSSDPADSEELSRKRPRYTPPESSERSKLLYPESSTGQSSGSECLVSGSRTSPQVSSNLAPSVSPSPTSASDVGGGLPSQHEVSSLGGSIGVGSSTGVDKSHWDVVSSGVEISSQLVDSPASGDMVIDESGVNIAPSSSSTCSRKESTSSPSSQDPISTSDRRHQAMEQGQLCSSSGGGSQTIEASQNNSVSSSLGAHHAGPHPPPHTSRSPKVYAYSTTAASSGISSSGSLYTSHASTAPTVTSSQQQGPMPGFPSFPRGTTTYTPYPFSALSVRSMSSNGAPAPTSSGGASGSGSSMCGPAASTSIHVQSSSSSTAPPSGNETTSPAAGTTNTREPPLLSSQYEPLSDED